MEEESDEWFNPLNSENLFLHDRLATSFCVQVFKNVKLYVEGVKILLRFLYFTFLRHCYANDEVRV